MRTLINWVLSALILWALAFLPFMHISFRDGVLSFLIAALLIGLVNALIVPIVKGLLRKQGTLLVLIFTIVIDAAALWLVGLTRWFEIEFFPTAIIAAVVLAVVNASFSFAKK